MRRIHTLECKYTAVTYVKKHYKHYQYALQFRHNHIYKLKISCSVIVLILFAFRAISYLLITMCLIFRIYCYTEF